MLVLVKGAVLVDNAEATATIEVAAVEGSTTTVGAEGLPLVVEGEASTMLAAAAVVVVVEEATLQQLEVPVVAAAVQGHTV